MKIRRYEAGDFKTVSKLFYETVHSVNAADYTENQLSVWTKSTDNLKSRQDDLINQHTLIAEINGETVGFGSIDNNGELDLLFVHKDFLRQGVATALSDELEKGFSVVKTFASVTAKPFFEKRGYAVIKEQEVERSGVKLKNYEMRKEV